MAGEVRFPAGLDRVKVYWIGLIAALRVVCKYFDLWKDFLPDDLPDEVEAARIACEAACAALKAYDLARKRGSYEQPGGSN